MSNLRWRLARRLVGPFVTLPERDGTWVVTRQGEMTLVIIEADKFRLKMRTDLAPKEFGNDGAWKTFGFVRHTGRFVGTVKFP